MKATVTAIAVTGAILSLGIAAATVHAQTSGPWQVVPKAELTSGPAAEPVAVGAMPGSMSPLCYGRTMETPRSSAPVTLA